MSKKERAAKKKHDARTKAKAAKATRGAARNPVPGGLGQTRTPDPVPAKGGDSPPCSQTASYAP